MTIVLIGWAVLAVLFSLALFRAAARPLPRPEEEAVAEPEKVKVPAAISKVQKPLPLAKPRAEVLASSYTTL